MTTSLIIISVLISSAIGILALSIILSKFPYRPGLIWIEITIGVGLGIGITSLLSFLWQVVIGRFYIGQIVFELCLVIILFTIWRGRPKARTYNVPPFPQSSIKSPWTNVLGILLGGEIVIGLFTFALAMILYPYGVWDAWRLWNRAARFLYGGGDYWRNAFSPIVHDSDYPVLLGASVARGWRYAGGETVFVPAIIAFVFVSALIGLLIFAISYFRGRNLGYMGGIILFSSAALSIFAPLQLADIPIAFYFLASIVLLNLHEHVSEDGLKRIFLLLAGVTSAFATWTKNEGWPFFIILFVIYFFLTPLLKERTFNAKSCLIFMAGALPVLLFTLFFKFAIAPTSYMFSQQPEEYPIMARILDPRRYQTIIQAFAQQLYDLTPDRSSPVLFLVVLAVIFGIDRQSLKRPGFLAATLIVLAMYGVHFIIYLISPYDLAWHIGSSFHRLSLQLWPILVFEVSLLISDPKI